MTSSFCTDHTGALRSVGSFFVLTVFLLFSQTCTIGQTNNDRSIVTSYSVGPGGGGALYMPTINPKDGNNIFIVCDMGSNFYTKDGKNFHNPGLYSHISRPPKFFFHPHDENIVYAALDNVVHISHDKGETWDYFFPHPDSIAGVTNDGLFVRTIVKRNGVYACGDTISVCVHPADPNTVFVLSNVGDWGQGYGAYRDYQNLAAQPNPTIHVTRDGGTTWQVFNSNIPGGVIRGDRGVFDGKKGEGGTGMRFPRAEMLVFKNELHLLSANGYFKFHQATGEIIDYSLYSNFAGRLHMSEDGKTIAAYHILRRDDAGENGKNQGFVTKGLALADSLYPFHIFKTTDGGKTFSLLSGNFIMDLVFTFYGKNGRMQRVETYANFKDIAVSDDGTLYVVFSAYCSYNYGWYSGVAKTADDGQTWQWIQDGSYRMGVSEVHFPTGAYPLGNGHSQYSIGICKSNPNHIITTTAYTAVGTKDGGLTWRDMSTSRTVEGDKNFFTTNGIEPAGQHTLAVNGRHHFTGWTDIGMWESVDDGKSWTCRTGNYNPNPILTKGNPGDTSPKPESNNNVAAVVFDPHNGNVVLAALPNRQLEGVTKNNSRGYVTLSSGLNWETAAAERDGVIKRSTDSGVTWNYVMSDVYVCTDGLVFDPLHPGVVYAGTLGSGVYRSTDNGLTWNPFNAGLTVQERTFDNVLYRGVKIHKLILGKDNRTLFALYDGVASDTSTNTKVFSLDIGGNAAAWQEVLRPNPATISKIQDMDKTASGILYMAPVSRADMTTWKNLNGAQVRPIINGGAYVSEDNGTSWRQIFGSRIAVQVLRTDSRHDNILYLGGGHKMWVSYKGKDTTVNDWVEIPGFHFGNPDLIVENPVDPTRIYVTTFGGGTWSLPVPKL